MIFTRFSSLAPAVLAFSVGGFPHERLCSIRTTSREQVYDRFQQQEFEYTMARGDPKSLQSIYTLRGFFPHKKQRTRWSASVRQQNPRASSSPHVKNKPRIPHHLMSDMGEINSPGVESTFSCSQVFQAQLCSLVARQSLRKRVTSTDPNP